MSAAAGGVLLLTRGAVAGAHHAALRVAAGADTHASLGCVFEGTVAGGKSKVGRPGFGSGSWDTRICSMVKVFGGIVDTHRIRKLAGIHAIVGIPECFEFTKGFD